MPLAELLIVSHTHWDREWYRTVDEFRARLIHLIDELLDDPPPPGESFLLDGQAILLEDYLTVRPERTAELSTLLREGRLEAGPWYVLADELIPSGEALVRNLLIGREVVRRFCGQPPAVLYCPDSFGHPAALPTIAAGFGCRTIVLWRGLGGARVPNVDCMRWSSPDGAEALVYHLPPDGYEFGSSLPAFGAHADARAQRIEEILGARANTGTALLLNGADHHARQPDLGAAVQALVQRLPGVKVRSTSLRDFASALEGVSDTVALPALTGELRDSYGYTWTLGGTLGTRAHQKRANARAERLLVRDVEPWLAQLDAAGNAAQRALLTAAWKTLLHAHPHDTLCGTSVDSVARATDARIQASTEQARALRDEGLASLIGHDSHAARTSASQWQSAVVLRNPAPRPRGGIAEVTLHAKLADVAVGPGSADKQGMLQRPPALRMIGAPTQLLGKTERVQLTESPLAYPDADLIVEARAVVWVNDMNGYSVRVQSTGRETAPQIPNPVHASAQRIENGLIRVDVSDEGMVSITDLETGRRIESLLTLERARDLGDSYTPSIREPLHAPTFARAKLALRGPLRGSIALIFRASGRPARSELAIVVSLDANASFVRVDVEGTNADTDQRLRLHIGTDLPDSATVADAAFWPVARVHPATSEHDARMEAVVPTAPLHRWVARFGAERGAVIISDGLAEYESLSDGGVAVTLVRSIAELSRVDLPERPGHAGWPAPTPESQCIGPFAARFAIQLFEGGYEQNATRIEHLADDVLTPIEGETLRSNLGADREAGRLELVGDGLAFRAALPARSEGWMTLRCVNLTSRAVNGAWILARSPSEAMRARLDETHIEPLRVNGARVEFTAAPYESVTVLVR